LDLARTRDLCIRCLATVGKCEASRDETHLISLRASLCYSVPLSLHLCLVTYLPCRLAKAMPLLLHALDVRWRWTPDLFLPRSAARRMGLATRKALRCSHILTCHPSMTTCNPFIHVACSAHSMPHGHALSTSSCACLTGLSLPAPLLVPAPFLRLLHDVGLFAVCVMQVHATLLPELVSSSLNLPVAQDGYPLPATTPAA
jgi:hypothetical protein